MFNNISRDEHGFHLKIIIIIVLIRANQFNLRHPCSINIAAPLREMNNPG
jgi:hypothetical protein